LQSGIFVTPLWIFTVIDVFSRVASCSSMCDTMLCHLDDSRWHWSCIWCKRFQLRVYNNKHKLCVIHQTEVSLQKDVNRPPTLSVCLQFTNHSRQHPCGQGYYRKYIVQSLYILKNETFYVHRYMTICFFVAFTTWLLGRLFYLMSSSVLASMVDLCITAQISVIQLLERHRCSVFISIIDEYLNCMAGEFDIRCY
jgi:hypothetical protein